MPYLARPNGIMWHYDLKGEGETVLFLHGWGGDSRLWSPQTEYFSKNYQTIAVDLPGHGKTTWQNLNFEQLAEQFEYLAERLSLQNVNIVASSMGGLFALKYLSAHPQNVKRLCLVGSLPKFCQSEDYPGGLDQERIKKLAGQLQTDYPSIVSIFFRSLFNQREREGNRFKWLQQFESTEEKADKEALTAFLSILEKVDLRPLLQNIQIPVQLINGTDDYICTPSSIQYLRDKLPKANFVLFKHCGHFPFISQPQEFNQVLEPFLKEEATSEYPKETVYDFRGN